MMIKNEQLRGYFKKNTKVSKALEKLVPSSDYKLPDKSHRDVAWEDADYLSKLSEDETMEYLYGLIENK